MRFFKKIGEWVRRYDDAHNFTCDICGREVFAGERVCAACRKSLPWNGGAICPLCGRRVKEEGVCLECKQQPLSVERARSSLLYEGEASRLILRFKRGEKYLYRAVTELCLSTIKEQFPEAEGLVPVPMTARAKRKRGYNQSLLLCEEFSRKLSLPVVDAAEKRHETKPQKTLGRRERQENLAGCFHVADRAAVKGKALLIVDDTLTTGATVSELSEALKRAGAARVFAFTATSVEQKEPFGKR